MTTLTTKTTRTLSRFEVVKIIPQLKAFYNGLNFTQFIGVRQLRLFRTQTFLS